MSPAIAPAIEASGAEVVTPRDQACCGALHLHSGRRDGARTRAERLVEAFDRAGVDHVVLATPDFEAPGSSSGCR